jgi:putative transposase
MNKHRSAARPRTHTKPKEHIATKPNLVWTWDITYLPSLIRGKYFYLYLILDIFSRKITGAKVFEQESAEHAASLISETCFLEGVKSGEIVLHSDNGSPMKGSTMLATLERLGVAASFSRPSVSNDNPYSEATFRTLKYCPLYPTKSFSSLEEAQLWVEGFVSWYNHEHKHSGIKFISPAERHMGLDVKILENRKVVYETAKQKNPNRWSGETRNWSAISVVSLNPKKELKKAA